jgi:hypothetical protein
MTLAHDLASPLTSVAALFTTLVVATSPLPSG